MTCRVVYRVEKAGNKGPHWSGPGNSAWCRGCANVQPNRWSVREKGSPLYECGEDGLFGCTSEAALCAWFNKKERENLHWYGYFVTVFMVSPGRAWAGNVQPGGAQQIIFDLGAATTVGRHSLLKVAA